MEDQIAFFKNRVLGVPHKPGESLSLLLCICYTEKCLELNSEHFFQLLFAYLNNVTKKVMIKKVNFFSK